VYLFAGAFCALARTFFIAHPTIDIQVVAPETASDLCTLLRILCTFQSQKFKSEHSKVVPFETETGCETHIRLQDPDVINIVKSLKFSIPAQYYTTILT
jgi:hypothetical protein